MSSPDARRSSFSRRVLWGVALGLCVGLFLGELARPLGWVGDAYVGLLQMTVLPYVVVALLANIGRLSTTGGRRLLTRATGVLAAMWVLGLVSLPLLAQAFPPWEVGSFYSSSDLEAPAGPDYRSLYIPSNPFAALAGGVVPAVAVFCILAGAVTIGLPGKERLIELLDLVAEVLVRLNRWVVRLTPVGVFGIAAEAAGTLTLGELSLLQGYIIAHGLGVGLLAFGALPLLVSCLTPLGYRQVLAGAREPLLTAFVTGSTFVTLPMIVDSVRRMLEDREGGEGVDPSALVALAYPFPHLGKVLSLLFVPFAAWFYGSAMGLDDFPGFLVSGLLGAFGSLVVAIPMLLEQQQVPSDIFQLFLLSGVVSARLSDVLGSMHILAFSLVAGVWMRGGLRVRRRRLLTGLAVLVAVGGGLIGGTRAYLAQGFVAENEKGKLLKAMSSREPRVESSLLPDASPNPVPLREGESRLERIRRRGVLRVGTSVEHLPFSFVNTEGELVGMDVDLAHRLALDLTLLAPERPVRLEFVPLDLENLEEQAASDGFDVAMTGIELTLKRSEWMDLTTPYQTVTAAMVVADHRREEFASMRTISAMARLRVAVWRGGYAAERVAQRVARMPGAELTQLDRLGEFFESPERFDALVTSAEVGSAWTLLYPAYSVVHPLEQRTGVPLVFALPDRDPDLLAFLNHWVELRKASGTVDRLRRYWILGEGAERSAPRWSVVRDVLGWVD